jgi:hypothetical protein
MIKLKVILKEIEVAEDVDADVQDAPRVKFTMPQFFVSNAQDVSKLVKDKSSQDPRNKPTNKTLEKPKLYDPSEKVLSDRFVNKMADAIYVAEGGSKARKPYGVLSVSLKGKTDEEIKKEARRITINSIKNNWNRWQKTNKQQDFIHFMADRWCPPSADKQGNINWKVNVPKILERLLREK